MNLVNISILFTLFLNSVASRLMVAIWNWEGVVYWWTKTKYVEMVEKIYKQENETNRDRNFYFIEKFLCRKWKKIQIQEMFLRELLYKKKKMTINLNLLCRWIKKWVKYIVSAMCVYYMER